MTVEPQFIYPSNNDAAALAPQNPAANERQLENREDIDCAPWAIIVDDDMASGYNQNEKTMYWQPSRTRGLSAGQMKLYTDLDVAIIRFWQRNAIDPLSETTRTDNIESLLRAAVLRQLTAAEYQRYLKDAEIIKKWLSGGKRAKTPAASSWQDVERRVAHLEQQIVSMVTSQMSPASRSSLESALKRGEANYEVSFYRTQVTAAATLQLMKTLDQQSAAV